MKGSTRATNNPEMAHVRTIRYPNGNQGFSTNKLGGDTVPGAMVGAPLSSAKRQEINVNYPDPSGMNPYNKYEGDSAGVLGAQVHNQDGGRTLDSPVMMSAPMPNKATISKASEVASADAHIGDAPHPSGVLGRG
jgi:hypothetical protein